MNDFDLIRIFDQPISYPRCFAAIAGVTGAIMLSHALYCLKRDPSPDGWLSKDPLMWELETGLTRFEQKTAKKKLKTLGILEEENANSFRVNTESLRNALLSIDPSDLDLWEVF